MIVLRTRNIDYSGYDPLPKWVAIQDYRLRCLWDRRTLHSINPMTQSIGPLGPLPRRIFIRVFVKGKL